MSTVSTGGEGCAEAGVDERCREAGDDNECDDSGGCCSEESF
jgi:hypothetical protein